MMDKNQISASFKEVQEYICLKLEELDGGSAFESDEWSRSEGGGGRTNTIKDGILIEKGGVAFSEVFGPVSEQMSKQLKLEGDSFFATGVSIVLHSKAVQHPIIHMNIRYFEIDQKKYWFGGGIDLTPIYVNEELAVLFHSKLKALCDEYDSTIYSQFKKGADEYFYLSHRNESRGVGGIFFDHFSANDKLSKEQIFDFCIKLGKLFPELYAEQISKSTLHDEMKREWQLLRRSRYVEFNLLHDRGTKFGIYSGGRTESILLSMPPEAKWVYNYQEKEEALEQHTQEILRNNRNWII
jgi:coproporphyrinogen III oxidase